jgi:hypothetical protein
MAGPSESSPRGVISPEARRRRREAWIIMATAVAVVVLVLFEARPGSPGTGHQRRRCYRAIDLSPSCSSFSSSW